IPSRPLPGGAKQSTLAALPSPAEPPILRLPARSAAESPISEWPPPTTPKTSFGLSFRKMIHRPRAPPQAWVRTDGLLDEPLGARDRLTQRLTARQARGDRRRKRASGAVGMPRRDARRRKIAPPGA